MEDTELNSKTIIFKIQVSVTNYDNQNNIISVIGGASDKNCGTNKIYTNPLPYFLNILLMTNNWKGKLVPPS